jgi:O-antigen/teichoic acid export membrane protein
MVETTQPQESLIGTVLKNATFGTLGIIVLKLANFLFNVFVVRRLGDDRMGQYATALAFVGVLQIIAELGITQYVMREIARDHGKVKTYFWNLVVLRVLLALFSLALIPVLGYLYGYRGDVLLGIAIYTSSFLLAAISMPLIMVLTAHEKLGQVTLINVGSQIIFMIIGTVILLSGLSFVWLIANNLVGLTFNGLLSYVFIRRLKIEGFRFNLNTRLWLPMIRAGLPFGINGLMMSIAYSIDTVILSRFVPDAEVGWYGVAYSLVFALLSFMGGFKQALVPSLSRVYAQDESVVKRWYQAMVRMIVTISLPIAVGGFLLASQIINFLYTAEFAPSALALKILIWDVPLLMFANYAGDMTTISNKERAAARIYTINTTANVVLNLLLIPRFGMLGAAVVTVLTDLISALQFYLLLRNQMSLPPVRAMILKAGAAAALMGGVVLLLRPLHFLIAIAAGVVIYFALAFLFRLLGPDELNLLRRVFASLRQRFAHE